MSNKKRFIEINRTKETNVFEIVQLDPKRKWMTETDGNAYRCVPLNVANQYGWTVLSPATFDVEWSGGKNEQDMLVSFYEPIDANFTATNFGHGILSIIPDFVVRTSKGISLYVRGIPNSLAVGLQPLDGVVETDWLPFTFTFNYKFTKPGKLTIKKDQPLFTFFPIERGFIESFDTIEKSIEENEDLNNDYKSYEKLRSVQNKEGLIYKSNGGTYGKGSLLGKKFDIENHQKTIKLSDFKRM